MDIKEIKNLVEECFEHTIVKASKGYTVNFRYLGEPYPLDYDKQITSTTLLGIDVKIENFIRKEAEAIMSQLQSGDRNGSAFRHVEAMKKHVMEICPHCEESWCDASCEDTDD